MEVGLALAMLLIMILRPSGLMGGRELSAASLTRAADRIRRLPARRPRERDHPAQEEKEPA
jgi:hypothetical protein